MAEIKFSTSERYIDVVPHPYPAKKNLPNWFRRIEENMAFAKEPKRLSRSWIKHVSLRTIKGCFPVRDYMTSGYIIPLWMDLGIAKDERGRFRQQIKGDEKDPMFQEIGLGWQDAKQVKGSPFTQFTDGEKLPKLHNPWHIQTPKGYSTLFFSPFYHESDIAILPAIADTDSYDMPVNFPFVMMNDNVGVPIGTPVVQAVPFKRENWKMSVSVRTEKNIEDAGRRTMLTRRSPYNAIWTKKGYN